MRPFCGIEAFQAPDYDTLYVEPLVSSSTSSSSTSTSSSSTTSSSSSTSYSSSSFSSSSSSNLSSSSTSSSSSSSSTSSSSTSSSSSSSSISSSSSLTSSSSSSTSSSSSYGDCLIDEDCGNCAECVSVSGGFNQCQDIETGTDHSGNDCCSGYILPAGLECCATNFGLVLFIDPAVQTCCENEPIGFCNNSTHVCCDGHRICVIDEDDCTSSSSSWGPFTLLDIRLYPSELDIDDFLLNDIDVDFGSLDGAMLAEVISGAVGVGGAGGPGLTPDILSPLAFNISGQNPTNEIYDENYETNFAEISTFSASASIFGGGPSSTNIIVNPMTITTSGVDLAENFDFGINFDEYFVNGTHPLSGGN